MHRAMDAGPARMDGCAIAPHDSNKGCCWRKGCSRARAAVSRLVQACCWIASGRPAQRSRPLLLNLPRGRIHA